MKLLNKLTTFEDENGLKYSIGDAYEMSFAIEFKDRIIFKPFNTPEEDLNKAIYCFSKKDGKQLWQVQSFMELHDEDERLDARGSYSVIDLYQCDDSGENLEVSNHYMDNRYGDAWYTKQRFTHTEEEYYICNNRGDLKEGKESFSLDLTEDEKESLLGEDESSGPLWYAKADEDVDENLYRVITFINGPHLAYFYIDIYTGKLTLLKKGVD